MLLTFAVLAAAMGLMAGCSNVKLTVRTPAYATNSQAMCPTDTSAVPITQEVHDLAVTAVDFDPSLNPEQIITIKPRSLLVAVENKGNRREGPFNVNAQLLSQDRRQVLMSAKRTISALLAGDITIVRFPVDRMPPSCRAYVLDTRVQTAQQEANTANNQRVLEILVNTGN